MFVRGVQLIVPGGSNFWCVSMVARPQPLREKGDWKAQIRRWTQGYFQVTEHPLGVQLNQTFRNGQRMAAVNLPIVQAVLKNWESVQQGHQETHNSKGEKYKRPCIHGYRLCSSWLDASAVAVLWVIPATYHLSYSLADVSLEMFLWSHKITIELSCCKKPSTWEKIYFPEDINLMRLHRSGFKKLC